MILPFGVDRVLKGERRRNSFVGPGGSTVANHLREFESALSGGAFDSRSSSSAWRSFVASAGSVPAATAVFSKK